LDLGFESLSHFSHSFKKKFGMAPTELTPVSP
jgi:AraC-like DNA-binding protein